MQNHKIVRLLLSENRMKIFQILICYADIRSVEERDLLIKNNIAVIGNAVRQREKILEQSKTAIASADPDGIFGNKFGVFHCKNSFHDMDFSYCSSARLYFQRDNRRKKGKNVKKTHRFRKRFRMRKKFFRVKGMGLLY